MQKFWMPIQGQCSMLIDSVSSRALKAYELDERDPPSSFVLQLYKKYAANPTWLLAGDRSKSNEQFRQYVEIAIIAVRTFAGIKKVSFTPEKEAKLALLIADLYMGGGEPGHLESRHVAAYRSVGAN